MEPVRFTEPVNPASIWSPIALSTLLKEIAPSLLTELLLSSVTATPEAVGVTEPPAAMSRSLG